LCALFGGVCVSIHALTQSSLHSVQDVPTMADEWSAASPKLDVPTSRYGKNDFANGQLTLLRLFLFFFKFCIFFKILGLPALRHWLATDRRTPFLDRAGGEGRAR
jgi:hypothetical protein